MTFHLFGLLNCKTEKGRGYNTSLSSVTEDPPPILIKTCKDKHLTARTFTVWQEEDVIAKVSKGSTQ